MGSISEIIKKLKEAKNLEVGEDETKRIRITISHGKVEVVTEAIPDLDALSLEQLYALQEAYEKWEEQLELLEQDLEDVNEKIEELEEEAEEAEEDE